VTWQNPWAFLGLLAIAVPVVIHLLGRHSARIRRFPTLRFIDASRLMATRWTSISDLPLLLARVGILAAAVAALAMPLLLTAGRQRERARSLARAIVVDTSASMRRAVRSAASLDEARRLATEAATSVTIRTDAPAHALAGAVGWLATQRGRREVIVISDFQTGALDSTDLASVPTDIGVGLTRIDVAAGSAPVDATTWQGGAQVVSRITTDAGRTDVEWSLRGAAVSADSDAIVIRAGPTERARAEAARSAARAVVATMPGTDRPIAIVFAQAVERSSVIRDAKPLGVAWQGDALARLRGDSMLAAAALDADVVDDGALAQPGGSDSSAFVSVARTAAGRPVALATAGTVAGRDRLILLPLVDAGSLTSAALIAAAMRAASVEPAIGELEPTTVPESVLAGWRRAPSSEPTNASAADHASDGRWLWIVALLLLAAETWMRRERRATRAPEVARERAA
jgi:hypothetical protein